MKPSARFRLHRGVAHIGGWTSAATVLLAFIPVTLGAFVIRTFGCWEPRGPTTEATCAATLNVPRWIGEGGVGLSLGMLVFLFLAGRIAMEALETAGKAARIPAPAGWRKVPHHVFRAGNSVRHGYRHSALGLRVATLFLLIGIAGSLGLLSYEFLRFRPQSSLLTSIIGIGVALTVWIVFMRTTTGSGLNALQGPLLSLDAAVLQSAPKSGSAPSNPAPA